MDASIREGSGRVAQERRQEDEGDYGPREPVVVFNLLKLAIRVHSKITFGVEATVHKEVRPR